MDTLQERSNPRQQTAGFVFCSEPGCDIVVGNGQHGATASRPCCRCAYEAYLAGRRRRYAVAQLANPFSLGYDPIAEMAE